jgi:hypothetical protein
MRFSAPSRGVAATVSLTAALIAPPVFAQDLTPIEAEIHAKVIPNKVGTPANPQPVKAVIDAKLVSEDGFERPVVQKGRVLLGKGGRWNGAKFPKCTAEILNRQGPAGCPKGSQFGKGYATGWADTVRTKPKITVFNGGETKAFGYVQLTNPARVNTAVTTTIKKLSGKWAYQLDFTVPEELLFVAGVPISLTEIHLELGRKDILVSTYCPPSNRWSYESNVRLVDGRDVAAQGTLPCRR